MLPLTDAAQEALEVGPLEPTVEVRYVPLESETFRILWTHRFFSDINSSIGVILDEHEEEWIPANRVSRVSDIAATEARPFVDLPTARFLEGLAELCRVADKLVRPVLFVL